MLVWLEGCSRVAHGSNVECGSSVARVWLECGSSVVQVWCGTSVVWLECGSSVLWLDCGLSGQGFRLVNNCAIVGLW